MSTKKLQILGNGIPKTAEDVGADAAGSAAQALSDAKTYTDQQIAAIPDPNVSGAISTHNSAIDAHQDIRDAIPTKVSELDNDSGFITEIPVEIGEHINDNDIHVTIEDKERWDQSILLKSDDIMLHFNNSTPSTPYSKDVAYGNGIFVVVSSNEDICNYSVDGINWYQATLPCNANWESITFGNGKFVTLGRGTNVAAYSINGINWTQVTLPSRYNWDDVVFGNGKFVAVGDGRYICSTDAINWTVYTFNGLIEYNLLAYGNGKFIAMRGGQSMSSNQAVYSEDGINWTEITLPISGSWYSIAYGNGKFVAVANGQPNAIYSEDGIVWTESSALPTSSYNPWSAITYGDNKFVACNMMDGIRAYSSDGINWTQTVCPNIYIYEAVIYGNNRFISIGNGCYVAYSLDGINWITTKTVLQDTADNNISSDVKYAIGFDTKQDKLIGTEDQIVGFDADGNAVAQAKPSYTASEVGAAPASHATDTTAHVTASERAAWNANSVEIDDTLTISGAAADAKAVGDAFKNVASIELMTSSEYEALETPKANTLYMLIDVSGS